MPFAHGWGNDDVGQHPADHFIPAVLEDTLRGGIEVHDSSLVVHADDSIDGRIDDGAGAFPAFTKGVFIAPSFADFGFQIFGRLYEFHRALLDPKLQFLTSLL